MAALREIIWHERRVELAKEGQRFFDINRHAIFPISQQQIDVSEGELEQDPTW